MRYVLILLLIVVLGGVGWGLYNRLTAEPAEQRQAQRGPAPVRVTPIIHGPIKLYRTFSGTLEASAEFVVAPKVGGRVQRLAVDLSDSVNRGQVVAELDDDEFVQAVAQAEADLAVAKANVTEAENALQIARRELERMTTLRERGVASESQFDTVRADELAKEAAVKVAEAQAIRAEASLKSAKIRLGYTQVTASWAGEDQQRVVAERLIDEGDTVSANTPMMSIVRLDPIKAVVSVTERDYARLEVGQPATLTADAHPGQTFEGKIARIAPVFEQDSRQARIELNVPNDDHQLNPGMFVRVRVMLDEAEDATIVPMAALTTRDQQDGVFIVNDDGDKVAWRPVKKGIVEGGRVQVIGEGLAGRVVTLGQQLIGDGAAVTIAEQSAGDEASDETTPGAEPEEAS